MAGGVSMGADQDGGQLARQVALEEAAQAEVVAALLPRLRLRPRLCRGLRASKQALTPAGAALHAGSLQSTVARTDL